MTKKFLHLVVTDPIVLVIIEHRHKNVKVREKLLQWQPGLQLNAKIGTFTPIRKNFIERQTPRGHGVAKWFKKLPQEFFAATARQRGKCHAQR